MAAVGHRLARLEKRLGVARPVPDDGEYDEFPVEEYVEDYRDMAELHAKQARRGDHWRRVYEEWLPTYEAAEAEAAAVGPRGVIRRRRWMSEAAQRQLEDTLEQVRKKWGPTFDKMKVERRSRRAPWPAPHRLEPEGAA